MRRMHFRFQRILELKERLEEAHKAALGQSVAVLEHEKQQLAGIRGLRVDSGRASDERAQLMMDTSLMQVQFSYGQRLERETLEQQQRVNQAQVIVDQRRQELIEATKQRRVFDVLKERVAAEYRREQRRQERILLDEAGKQVHLRKEAQPMETRGT